jgi:2-oxoglutarate ferredoxin oxidoreductase subunit alpha
MKLRKLLVNMIYVGIVGQLLGIETAAIDVAVEKQFEGKQKAIDLNKAAVRVGQKWVEQHPLPDFGYRVERRNLTAGKIIIDGNSAAGLGAVFAGLTVLTWYPITPSSSLCEAAIEYLRRFRTDENGKANYAVVQAEDEIAAIGMVIGAAWAGARSMTSTSGPGISLMSEFAGLAYYAEVPAVVWDVQRVGPSTGLPTRTAQGDVSFTATLSHGDTHHLVLFPSSVAECFTMAHDAFDLAEEFQTPVFVLSDLDLGMNNWMSDPFEYPARPLRRGKVLGAKELEKLGGFARYMDVDKDGIPYRTLPGTPHPKAAFFTRGSGHDEHARYTESHEVYQRNLDRLRRKTETARARVPAPVVDRRAGTSVGLIAYGSTDFAIEEARDRLRADGLETSYLRIRALPLNDDIKRFVEAHDRVYLVEQNRDGQMADLLRLHMHGLPDERLRSILHYNGLPIDARTITEGVLAGEKVEVE